MDLGIQLVEKRHQGMWFNTSARSLGEFHLISMRSFFESCGQTDELDANAFFHFFPLFPPPAFDKRSQVYVHKDADPQGIQFDTEEAATEVAVVLLCPGLCSRQSTYIFHDYEGGIITYIFGGLQYEGGISSRTEDGWGGLNSTGLEDTVRITMPSSPLPDDPEMPSLDLPIAYSNTVCLLSLPLPLPLPLSLSLSTVNVCFLITGVVSLCVCASQLLERGHRQENELSSIKAKLRETQDRNLALEKEKEDRYTKIKAEFFEISMQLLPGFQRSHNEAHEQSMRRIAHLEKEFDQVKADSANVQDLRRALEKRQDECHRGCTSRRTHRIPAAV